MTIESLNKQFGIGASVTFHDGKGGLSVIHINTPHATTVISLYGAQALSFVPKDQKDVLWMSEHSHFENGKAIRGGIPVCFPWFGPHLTDKALPQHGFARLQQWEVTSVEELRDEIVIKLSLRESPFSLAMWPYPFNATAEFTVGKTLDVSLTVTNTGSETFEYSDALHTYFNISNIEAITIEGLQNATYYEGFDMELKQQTTSLLTINSETNRRYVNHRDRCIIHDPGYSRTIKSFKTGSNVTVVWNPWEATAKTMTDIHPGGYKTFVCAEPANAYPGIDMITLVPGETHTLATSIQQF
jgi:glucose-6-phosphate 1-epimerase